MKGRFKQCGYGTVVTPARFKESRVPRATTAILPKAADTRRAVTTRTGLAADNISTSVQCNGSQVVESRLFDSLYNSHAEPGAQAPSGGKRLTAHSYDAKKTATQQHSVERNKGLQKQQTAAQPGAKKLQHGAAELTAHIVSASGIHGLETLIAHNKSNFNHIHVSASFRVLSSLYEQTGQQQDRERLAEMGQLLLPLARQHAAAFSTANIVNILYETATLQLQPGADWYHTLLQRFQDNVEPAAAAAEPGQQQQCLQERATAAMPAEAQQPQHLLHGKQLTVLISNAGSPHELDAILQHTWPVVSSIHVTAAAQQLVRMHQRDDVSQQQQRLLQELCRKLLLHATNPAAPAAATEHASTAATMQQQQELEVTLSARQVAVLLHAASVLQVQNVPEPHLLLQQLLQRASETAAATVHAAALCSILSGTAWLMQQKVPQIAQEQQQQHQNVVQEQQQHQHGSQNAVLHHQQHVMPGTAEQVAPDMQRQVLKQRRLELLQQQQQQQSASAAPSEATTANSCTSRHPTEQQQQRQQILQLLGDICTSCCQSSSLLREQGLSLKQLSSVLAQFAELQAVPQAAVLQQLLTAAGLGGSTSSSAASKSGDFSSRSSGRFNNSSSGSFSSMSSGRVSSSSSIDSTSMAGVDVSKPAAVQHQQQQQQEELPRHAAGHAAAVLWQLGVLAGLEQQQQQRPAAMLGAGSSSSSRRGSQVLQALSNSTCSAARLLQPVCSAAAAATAGDGNRSSLRAVYVAVGALSKLGNMLADEQLAPSLTTAAAATMSTPGHVRSTTVTHAGSRLGSTPAAAAAVAAPAYRTNEHRLLQSKAVPGLCSIGVQPDVVQQLCEYLLTVAHQQQMAARQSSEPVRLMIAVGDILQHLPHMQQKPRRQPKVQQQRQQQQQGLQELLGVCSYASSWLTRYITAVLPQLNPAQLDPMTQAELLRLLVQHKAYQLPVGWYRAVEQSVLLSVERLQSVDQVHSKRCRVAEGVQLIHTWVQLLLVPRQLQQQAAVLKQYSSSSSSALPRVCTAHRVSEATVCSICRGLAPHLVHMDAETLGLAAWAAASLGPVDAAVKQQWLLQVMRAVAAAAGMATATTTDHTGSSSRKVSDAATAGDSGGSLISSSSTNAARSSSSNQGSIPAAAAAGLRVSFPPEALQRILQSFVLLRCRPPVTLLQHMLAVAAKDMALYKGSAFVGLMLVLVQLRVKPGSGWLRSLLLRVQGRLRALSFEELTQLSWCLAQLGVVPPQTWMDEFADTAALHVIAWRKQQQHQAGSGAPVCSSSNNGAAGVRAWQLYVMHWALIVCWRYRGSHAVGKLQYRLVRELNRVAWGVDRNLKKSLSGRQAAPQKQQQQHLQGPDHKVLQDAGCKATGKFSCSTQKAPVAEDVAALRKLGHLRRRHYRLLRSGQLHREKHKRQQQQQQQPGVRAASSTSIAGLNATATVAGSRGKGRAGSTAAAARRLRLQLMRQRAAAVWPRQWDPICLAQAAEIGRVKS